LESQTSSDIDHLPCRVGRVDFILIILIASPRGFLNKTAAIGFLALMRIFSHLDEKRFSSR